VERTNSQSKRGENRGRSEREDGCKGQKFCTLSRKSGGKGKKGAKFWLRGEALAVRKLKTGDFW